MYLRVAFLVVGLLITSQASAQVTISRGTSLSVDAARDGRIAIDLRGEIWIVPGGGGEARQLVQELKSAQRPRWSPDDQRLVYSAAVDGRQGVWIYEFGSNETRQLVTDSHIDLHPSWHPGNRRHLH